MIQTERPGVFSRKHQAFLVIFLCQMIDINRYIC